MHINACIYYIIIYGINSLDNYRYINTLRNTKINISRDSHTSPTQRKDGRNIVKSKINWHKNRKIRSKSKSLIVVMYRQTVVFKVISNNKMVNPLNLLQSKNLNYSSSNKLKISNNLLKLNNNNSNNNNNLNLKLNQIQR